MPSILVPPSTRNLFLACKPLAGWRHVAVTQRRTMEDFAHQMRWLVDEAYPETPVVRVVMDNPVSSTGQALNTHRPASLYPFLPFANTLSCKALLDSGFQLDGFGALIVSTSKICSLGLGEVCSLSKYELGQAPNWPCSVRVCEFHPTPTHPPAGWSNG